MYWWLVVLVILPCIVAQNCGVFRVNDTFTFDLTPLTSPKGYLAVEYSTGNPNQPAFIYGFNFCHDQSVLNNTGPPVTAVWAMQQTAQNTGAMPVGVSLGSIEYQNGQVVITYVNKECCTCKSNTLRSFKIHLVCNPSATTPIVGNVTESYSALCEYDVTVQSAAACAGGLTDCCVSHNSTGCSDVDLEQCVCKAAPYCCSSAWNSTCVDLVQTLGCGSCSLGPCCTPHLGRGCDDRQISRCVCEKMSNCCTSEWGNQCVAAVNKFGCANCQAVCCEPGPCTNSQVRECVCSKDMYCCATEWDATCTQEALLYNCTACPSTTTSSASTKNTLPRPLQYSILE